MTAHEETYRYADKHLWREPYHYMYTPFEGADFLRAYLLSRQKAASDLRAKCERAAEQLDENSPAMEIAKAIGAQAADPGGPLRKRELTVLSGKPGDSSWETSELLLDLWSRNLYREDATVVGQMWLDLLIKRFEVSKRLFISYTDSLRPGTKDSGRAENYLLLAALLLLLNRISSNLRYINASLKLNDLLLSGALDELASEYEPILLGVIEMESAAIQALLDEQEVSL